MTAIHEATGSYALHALDGADLAEFETHMAGCRVCQAEVADFGETAAELSLLNLATPPPVLRVSIIAAIGTTPQVRAANGAVRSAPPFITNGSRYLVESRRAVPSSDPRRATPDAEVSGPSEPEPHVDELARRRQRRRTRILSGLVAAMLALAVGLGGVTYTLVQQRNAQVAQITLEQELYSAPDVITTTRAIPGGGQVTFLASKQLNRALFLGSDLPDPGQNRYQLWTVTGSDLKSSSGVFRDVQVADTASGIKTFFSGDVARADFLAVNLEPAGSTPVAPTSSLLAAGPTAI